MFLLTYLLCSFFLAGRLYLQGIGRFLNAFIAGLFISFDYKWEELNLAGIAISIEYKNEHSSESLASVWSSLANMKNAKLKFDWSNCDEQSYRACHLRSADRLVRIALENGGLYVKLGQGLASLNHVLPEEYVKTLAILQVHKWLTFSPPPNKLLLY